MATAMGELDLNPLERVREQLMQMGYTDVSEDVLVELWKASQAELLRGWGQRDQYSSYYGTTDPLAQMETHSTCTSSTMDSATEFPPQCGPASAQTPLHGEYSFEKPRSGEVGLRAGRAPSYPIPTPGKSRSLPSSAEKAAQYPGHLPTYYTPEHGYPGEGRDGGEEVSGGTTRRSIALSPMSQWGSPGYPASASPAGQPLSPPSHCKAGGESSMGRVGGKRSTLTAREEDISVCSTCGGEKCCSCCSGYEGAGGSPNEEGSSGAEVGSSSSSTCSCSCSCSCSGEGEPSSEVGSMQVEPRVEGSTTRSLRGSRGCSVIYVLDAYEPDRFAPRLHRSDPVAKYHAMQQKWKADKFLTQKGRKELVWDVRYKMAEKQPA